MKERIKTCAGCIKLSKILINNEWRYSCPTVWTDALLGNTKRCEHFEYNADTLTELVRRMRNAQKAYFKSKDEDILIQSKRLEQGVDDCISEE